MNRISIQAAAAALALAVAAAPVAAADGSRKGNGKPGAGQNHGQNGGKNEGDRGKRCKTRDIAGTWKTYQSTSKADDPALEGWARCRLVFRGNGRIRADRSACFDDQDNRVEVEGGRFRVSQRCRVRGTVVDGNGITYRLVDAQMERHRNTIMGVGRTDAGQVGTFMAVKR